MEMQREYDMARWHTDDIPIRCQSREARSEICLDYIRELPSQANLFETGPDPPRSAPGRARPPDGNSLINLLLETGPDPPWAAQLEASAGPGRIGANFY